MLISTEIASFRRKLGDDKSVIRLLKNAGFTAYDYSMITYGENGPSVLDANDYETYARELRKYADGIGISCNQAHAPYPMWGIPRTEASDRLYYAMICRAIEISGILGEN